MARLAPESLHYGVVARSSPRRVVGRLVLALLVASAGAGGLYAAARAVYWWDYDRVNAILADGPGAKVNFVRGFDEDVTYSLIEAEVALDGSPGRTISFRAPTAYELRRGSHLRVAFGPISLCAVAPEGYCLNYKDLGRDGVFANFLPFEVNSVEDLALRYDEIVAVLSRAQPRGVHRGLDGRLYSYAISTARGAAPIYADMLKMLRDAEAREKQNGTTEPR
jgi:hypothetical protein